MRGIVRILESSIKAHGVRGPNSKGEYQIRCPFCRVVAGKADDKFKLQYNPTKNVYYCYRCESSGHAELPTFTTRNTISVAQQQKVNKPLQLGPPPGFVEFNHNTVGALALKPYVDYLYKRLLMDKAMLVGAGACVTGRYAGRVVFPLRTPAGPWRGFSSRTIYNAEPKYLYPAGMDRKNELYGLDFIKGGEIWLTEGVLDAIALYPHGVAAFGKNVTDEQIEKLVRFRVPIVVCLDGDAWEEAMVLATRFALHGNEEVTWCKLPPQTDPGVLGWDVRKYVQRL
jgi:hypothetical protein